MNLWKVVIFESVQNIVSYNSKCDASLYNIMYIVQNFHFGYLSWRLLV